MRSVVVVRVVGLVTVQDLGRPGRMHEALAPGGALVPELLVAANRAVKNRDGAPAIEVLGQLIVRAQAAIEVALNETTYSLAEGEELAIASEPRRVAYLALRGGVDAPLVLGSRSTQMSAGFGAPLRAGESIVAVGDATPVEVVDETVRFTSEQLSDETVRFTDGGDETVSMRDAFDHDETVRAVGEEAVRAVAGVTREDTRAIRVIAGPDLDAFGPDALAALCAGPYQISPTSDRVGTRLAGAAIPRVEVATVSRPMVRGAIEVPADGQPIVLGPEHPTTGGYPVLGVIASADLGRFFAIRLGGEVRFVVDSK